MILVQNEKLTILSDALLDVDIEHEGQVEMDCDFPANSELQPDCGQGPKHEDIKIEYHPDTGRRTVEMSFEGYSELRMKTRATASFTEGQLPDDQAYQPFQTRTDFEVSEFALEASLNEAQTNKLLSLIHRIADGYDKFTIMSHRQMRQLWDLASTKLVKVDLCSSGY